MANAISSVNGVLWIDGIGLTIDLNTCYSGDDVPNMCVTAPVQVVIDPADSAAEIKTKMAAAVTQVAADNGITIGGGAMILPAFDTD